MAAALPSGTVTFLFTDIEGSTQLLHRLGETYAQVLGEHHQLLRQTWTEHGGVEVDTAGDGFFVAFPTAPAAVAAAAAATRALADKQLQAARTLGDRRQELSALDSLARGAETTGHADMASGYRQEALPIARALGERATVVEFTAALGATAAQAGAFDEAQRLYVEARRLFDQSLVRRNDAVAALGVELDAEAAGTEAAWYDKFGEIALKTGDREAAVEYFQKALRLVETSQYDPSMVPHLRGNLTVVRGDIARLRGETAEALRWYLQTRQHPDLLMLVHGSSIIGATGLGAVARVPTG